MNVRNFILYSLCPLFLYACSDTNARVAQMETSLIEVEEKVDALLTYSNTTHDAITDIDLRMEALEQDAKKRGVPVRIKGVDLAAAKAELDRVDGQHAPAPLLQPSPNNIPPSSPPSSTDTLPTASSQSPASPQTPSSPSQDALAHLAQDEQSLLAQSPTLAAALQNNTQSPPSDLPEKDMNAPKSTDNSRRSQTLSDGYSMAEGISIRLPDTGVEFEYPEHTQTMPSLDSNTTQDTLSAQATQNPLPSNQSLNHSQNIGPITGQNLQDPNMLEAGLAGLTGQAGQGTTGITPDLSAPLSPYTADTIPEPVSLTPKASQTQVPATVPQRQASAPQSAPSTQSQAVTNTYDGAMNLYKSRQYAESEKAFDAFLQANPNSPLAPNALYWKGETNYARALYPQAIFAFKEVQTRYPKHSKAPDSLLKTAMSYAKLGDTENANLHYTVLKEDFPNSSAAKRVPQ